MSRLRRIAAAGAVVAGAMTLFGVAPASAHDSWIVRPDGCLQQLHTPWIGGLDYVAGTCDGRDNYWRGRVRDDHATNDGSCVRAVLDNVVMAVSCNSSGAGFTFFDPQGNSNAWTCMTETNSPEFDCSDNWDF
jgi:hypothetical protein